MATGREAKPTGSDSDGGVKYQACCPAHPDKNPSLSICLKSTGHLVVKCHAGCGFEEIAAAVGMEVKDFFSFKKSWSGDNLEKKKPQEMNPGVNFTKNFHTKETSVNEPYHNSDFSHNKNPSIYFSTSPSPHSPRVKIEGGYRYDYFDGETHVYSKLIFKRGVNGKEVKKVLWAHQDDKEDWVWRKGNHPNVLFNALRLEEAKKEGEHLLVCEGESDVMALTEKGFYAVCSPGTGVWDEHMTRALMGVKVVGVHDYDAPGFKRQRSLFEAWLEGAVQFKWIDLTGFEGRTDGSDVRQWFEEGHTAEELQELVDGAMWAKEALGAKKKHLPFDKEETALKDFLPIDVFDPVTRGYISEIERVEQVSRDMAIAMILSLVSFCCGKNIEVEEKEGFSHYLSSAMLIMAESGERKSRCMNVVFKPVLEQTEEDENTYNRERYKQKIRVKLFETQEKKLLARAEKDCSLKEGIVNEINELREKLEAKKPKYFRKFTSDFTGPALFKAAKEHDGHYGIITPDGGNVLDYIQGKGHGTDGTQNDSQILKMTGGDPVTRERSGKGEEVEGTYIKRGALTICICVQPQRSQEFLSNHKLDGSGLLARILPVPCKPKAGTRLEKEEGSEQKYSEEYKPLFDKTIKKRYNSNDYQKIKLSKEAKKERVISFNEKEKKMKEGGEYENVKKMVNKNTTCATTMAARLWVLDDLFSKEENPIPTISLEQWRRGKELADAFLEQQILVSLSDPDDLVYLEARKISTKILNSKLVSLPSFTKRAFQKTFLQNHKIPTKTFVKEIIELLIEKLWVKKIPKKPFSHDPQEYQVIT